MIRNNEMLYINNNNEHEQVFNETITGQVLSFIDNDNVDAILKILQWKIFDIIKSVNDFKFFKTFEDIGLENGSETLNDIFSNMQSNSILLVSINNKYGNQNYQEAGYPSKNGTLIVINSNIAKVSPYKGINQFAIWCDTLTNFTYFASYNGYGSSFLGFRSFFEIPQNVSFNTSYINDTSSYLYVTRTGNTIYARGVLRNNVTLTTNNEYAVASVDSANGNKQRSLASLSCTGNNVLFKTIINDYNIIIVPVNDIPANSYIYINCTWKCGNN